MSGGGASQQLFQTCWIFVQFLAAQPAAFIAAVLCLRYYCVKTIKALELFFFSPHPPLDYSVSMDTWLQFPLQSANQRLKTGSRSIALWWRLHPSGRRVCFMVIQPAEITGSAHYVLLLTFVPSLSTSPSHTIRVRGAGETRRDRIAVSAQSSSCLRGNSDWSRPSGGFLCTRLWALLLFAPPETHWRQNKHTSSAFNDPEQICFYNIVSPPPSTVWIIHGCQALCYWCGTLTGIRMKLIFADSKTTKPDEREAD